MRTHAVARLAAGLIALVAWLGLIVQFQASLGLTGSRCRTIWVMLRTYTVLTNFAVGFVFPESRWDGQGSQDLVCSAARRLPFCRSATSIALLLRGLLDLSGGAKLADMLLHHVMPVLVPPLYWLVLAPKGGLRWRHPLLWLGVLIAYQIYTVTRGLLEGVYAYPFMNVARLGWLAAAANALVISLGVLAASFALVWLDGLLSRAENDR